MICLICMSETKGHTIGLRAKGIHMKINAMKTRKVHADGNELRAQKEWRPDTQQFRH